MKRKMLMFLIFLMACMIPVIFIGCMTDSLKVPDDYHAAGYQKVVFYYNGGQNANNFYAEYFIKNSEKDGKPEYYALPVPTGTSSTNSIAVPTKIGYRFSGWYEVKFDAFTIEPEEVFDYYEIDGVEHKKPVIDVNDKQAVEDVPYIIRKNESGELLNKYGADTILTLKDIQDEQDGIYGNNEKIFIGPWNFDLNRVTKDVCLVAIWEPIRKFVVVPPENKSDFFDDEDYDNLPLLDMSATGAIKKPTSASSLPQKPGFIIEDLYLDRACTIKVPFVNDEWYPPEPEFVTGTERFKVFPIYTKWIDAKFTKVTRSNDITSDAEKSYYIMNNLDFGGSSISIPDSYKGEIRGNGFTWSNINITKSEATPKPGLNVYGGVFGNLVGAKIRDITFKNINITFIRLDSTKVGDKNLLKNPVRFNMFAKSIDSRSSVLNVNLGVPGDTSTFIISEFTSFDVIRLTRYDPVYGFPYRLSSGIGELIPIPAQGVDGEGNPIYPANGSIYNGYKISYGPDNFGDYQIAKYDAVDILDGKSLSSTSILPMPSFAPEPTVDQDSDNFLTNGVKLDNVNGCTYNITKGNMSTPWEITYDPVNDNRPRQLADIGVNKFAGWYTQEKLNGNVVGYKWYGFDPEETQVVRLFAMWKK